MKVVQVLNEYKGYMGQGEKPVDFDSFWDNELKKLNELSLDYELEKVDIPSKVAEFYNLYFIGVSGAKIECQYIKPKHIQGKVAGRC